ncbi:hypothetical protein BC941DRAFT_419180 [Chlamydoabsidia padenii]|nr:hypothetical protein BC941DRAFT_419180 [Chlamydoabsidia padenii]
MTLSEETVPSTLSLPRKQRHRPILIQRHDKRPMLIQRPHCANYTQACLLLHAIEINRRQSLQPRCLAYLANYVVKAWETHPDEIKVRQLYQWMQHLMTTTAIQQPTLEKALFWFCQNKASTPTPCPAVTLLIAIGYIERLNKKCDLVKGTVGCGSRLIMIAYLMAAKFLHDNLQLIIHTPTTPPCTPITSLPTRPSKRYLLIIRLELEFLYFLDHDLSTADPVKLVLWAHTFDTPPFSVDCTSADEGDDEMDDDNDDLYFGLD